MRLDAFGRNGRASTTSHTDARGPFAMCLTTSGGDMTYRVEMSRRASRGLQHLYQYIHAESSPAAIRWYNGLERTIGSFAITAVAADTLPAAVSI